MFSFLAGTEPSEDALLGPFERLGEVTARLHGHARHWHRPEGFVRQTWDFATMLGSRPIWGDWRAGMGMDAARQAQLQRWPTRSSGGCGATARVRTGSG